MLLPWARSIHGEIRAAVRDPVGAMSDTLETLVAGAILGLVYFSDLSRHFERSPAGVTNGAHASA